MKYCLPAVLVWLTSGPVIQAQESVEAPTVAPPAAAPEAAGDEKIGLLRERFLERLEVRQAERQEFAQARMQALRERLEDPDWAPMRGRGLDKRAEDAPQFGQGRGRRMRGQRADGHDAHEREGRGHGGRSGRSATAFPRAQEFQAMPDGEGRGHGRRPRPEFNAAPSEFGVGRGIGSTLGRNFGGRRELPGRAFQDGFRNAPLGSGRDLLRGGFQNRGGFGDSPLGTGPNNGRRAERGQVRNEKGGGHRGSCGGRGSDRGARGRF